MPFYAKAAITLCIFACYALLPEIAFAQNGGALDFISAGSKTLIIGLASIIIILCSLFATMFAVLIGDLMGSTFILDSGMGETLRLVWVVMRNFVNVAFVIGLLALAVVVVLGVGDEQGGISYLKKVLPKMLIAIVAVNFTFFGARLVLTVNDVLATAVFSLPQAVWYGEVRGLPCPTSMAEGSGTPNCLTEISETLETSFNSVDAPTALAGEAPTDAAAGNQSAFASIGTAISGLYTKGDAMAVGMINRENFALAMLTNMLDFKSIITMSANNQGFFGTLTATLGAMVSTVVVTFVFFMLFVALVVRMVYLWVLIAISPLALAATILKDMVPNMPGADQLNLVGDFIKYAFFPLFVAFPLAIGMIMIFAGNSMTTLSTTSSDAITAAIMGDFYALLWWAAAIGIMWVGSKKAIENFAPSAANSMVDGAYNFANSAGKLALTSFKYAPIVPVPGGGMSIKGIGLMPGKIQSALNKKPDENASNQVNNLIGGGPGPTHEEANNALLNKQVKGMDELVKALREDHNFGGKGHFTIGKEVAAKWHRSMDDKTRRALRDSNIDITSVDSLSKVKRVDIANALKIAGATGAQEVYDLYGGSSEAPSSNANESDTNEDSNNTNGQNAGAGG